jgi:hypothetical protein
MSSGEDLIATVNSSDSIKDTITLQDVIVAIPTGSGSLGFVPWSPLLSKNENELVVSRKFVVYMAEPDEEVVMQYNKMFNKIITPIKKIIK